MNLFMNPSLFASLSYHKIFLQPRQGLKLFLHLVEENLIILSWAVRKKGAKEARDEAREEACNRL
jgi:hypothetical protein